MIQNDATCQYDGFMFHSTLGYGKMIKTYPYGCQSPKSQSWPLFLREQQSGTKRITSTFSVFRVEIFDPPKLYFDLFEKTLLRPILYFDENCT